MTEHITNCHVAVLEPNYVLYFLASLAVDAFAHSNTQAVVGSLGIQAGRALVDVGAGLGYFALAAAARGHRVLAFESAPKSVAAFKVCVNNVCARV